MASREEQGTFHEVSSQVVKRLFVANWFESLARTAPIIYTTAAAIWLIAVFWGELPLGAGAAAILVVCQMLATAIWTWWRRPTRTAALATWDGRSGRSEMFTSAYCFESVAKPTAGQQLHLARASARLPQDLPSLPKAVPTKLPHRAWIAPTVFLLLAIVLADHAASSAPARVDDGNRQLARQVAKSLAERNRMDDKSAELSDDEKEKLKELEDSVDETINKLNELGSESRRDVLKELQQRADAAEKLAESLGGADGDPLSSELIEELSRHADTTDFASALQADDLERMADEAGDLASQLDDPESTEQERERIKKALDSSLRKATPQDKATELAKQLAKARKDLQNKKPRLASKRIQELSEDYRRRLQRRNTQQQLRQLSKRLHRAGQKIFGQRNAGIRRLARKSPASTQRLGMQNLQRGAPRLLQRRSSASSAAQLARASGQPNPGAPTGMLRGPVPGQGQLPLSGQSGMMPGQAPIPGQGTMPGLGQAPVPGTGCPPGGVPGQGQCQAPGAGQAPGQGAGQGGHQAGHGSAAVGAGSTSPFKAKSADRVQARVSGQGPANVREIAGGEHTEGTELDLQDLAINTMSAEEEALADEPLPLSRREQVLRYFTALRRQLANDESNNE